MLPVTGRFSPLRVTSNAPAGTSSMLPSVKTRHNAVWILSPATLSTSRKISSTGRPTASADLPAGPGFRRRIEELDGFGWIERNHDPRPRLQRRGEQRTLFANLQILAMLVQRDLDAGVQVRLLKRFGDVAERFGVLWRGSRWPRRRAPLNKYRNIEALAQNLRGGSAVHVAFDADIHERQVGRVSSARAIASAPLETDPVTVYPRSVKISRRSSAVIRSSSTIRMRADMQWFQAAAGNVSWISVPTLVFSSILAPNCSASVRTSRNPRVRAVSQSMSLRRPTPLSATTSRAIRSENSCSSMRISPVRPSGNAYFSELESSSLIMRPHGTAASRFRYSLSRSVRR